MASRANRDVAAGIALAAFGIFFAGYAATQLPLGSFKMMGSGMFPFLTGIVLAVTGVALAATTLARTREPATEPAAEVVETPQWLSLVVVVAAIAAFALLIRPFGIAPSIFALTLVASIASDKLTVPATFALAAGLSFAAWTIFILALGLPLRLVNWPL